MALDASTLFTRFGHAIAGLNELNTFRGTTATARGVTVRADYASAQTDWGDTVNGAVASLQASGGSYATYWQTLTQGMLIEANQQNSPPLQNATLSNSIGALVAYMQANTQTISQPTVGATPTAGSSNIGNGSLVASLIEAADGLSADYVLAEMLSFSCTGDSYPTGTATAGQEPFNFVGGPAAPSTVDFTWPGGSGSSGSLSACSTAATSTTLLTDGDFEQWTSNVPTKWTVAVGTPGTTIFQGTQSYTGASDLKLEGNGTELTTIRQILTGLTPQTAYALSYRIKAESSAPAAGVLRTRLVDGGTAVINDPAGNANSLSLTLSGITTSYVLHTVFFRTPVIMPSTVQLEIGLSTAITNTSIIDIDSVILQPATKLYIGGPLVAIVAGSTPFAKADSFTLAVTNSGTTATLGRGCDRLLGLRALGWKFPSTTGSPTYSDSLVT